jgi:TrmH family RNA methyltransferase
MAIKRITSADNPLVRELVRLSGSARAVRESGKTIAEGIHLAQALLDADVRAPVVIVRSSGATAEALTLAHELVRRFDAAQIEMAAQLYDRVAPVEHGVGLLAVVEFPRARLPARIDDDVVYLDGGQEPGNVGAIVRTAAAAGVRTLVTAPGTACLWAPRALRAGMGAHFRVQMIEGVPIADLRRAFRGTLLGTDGYAQEGLFAATWGDGPIGWIFGAEGRGLSAEARSACDRLVRIPQVGAVESLNVAAAAAICLFERLRRRAGTV